MTKRIIILVLASALTAPVLADLCNACRNLAYVQSIGKCVNCGGTTPSSACPLCPQCSKQLGQCERCRKPLGAATRPATLPAKPR